MNSALKTHNCTSWTTFQRSRHFHGLCLAAATAAPALCPPAFSSQPWEPGGTHSCRGLRTVQRWRPGSFGPLPCITSFIPEKICSRYSIFLKQWDITIKKKLFIRSLSMQETTRPGLKRFIPPSYSLHYQCAIPFPLY